MADEISEEMARKANETVVRVTHINKSFAGPDKRMVAALRNVSFGVQRGEVIAIMGPSGSGKSTCLRTLNGLERIDSGRIEICGQDLGDPKVPVHLTRRRTAMIFQHFELFPHLTVLDNVRLAPQLTRSLSHDAATKQALECLEQVGMDAFSAQHPSRLSGGQKQRVAIARALAVKPDVLLCDEPTSALDPELVSEVTALLLRIAASGMTMILVTHEMSFARNACTRCLFLEQGQITADLPRDVFFGHGELRTSAIDQVPRETRERIDVFLGKLKNH
jgi:ABC-type polar amino acid transport system ATPase subunit